MKCPVCTDRDLVMSERQGIEIDYCPNCRGVWLDRGELDKILERALQQEASSAAPPPPPAYPPPPQQQQYPPNYRPDLDDSKYGYQYKRKKSWWNEIFD